MQTPVQPPSSPSRVERPALWTLIGVITGFSLPIITCVTVFSLITLIGGLSSQGVSSGLTDITVEHISGPITGPAVLIIDIEGDINTGSTDPFSTSNMVASDNIANLIRSASEDSDVRAILLRVNSPGGSVVGSDEIYQSLKDSRLPVVVYVRELAASGGYYISMAADSIYANPNSLIGSVGVISTIPNVEELLEKVGVEFSVFTSGESKDFGSLYRRMTEEEEVYWQGILDETYDRFVQIVAEERNLPLEQVLDFADGRVYTVQQALDRQMIDALGYEKDAIEKAATLGSIPGTPRVIRYSDTGSLLSLLLSFTNPPANLIESSGLDQFLTPSLEYRWVP